MVVSLVVVGLFDWLIVMWDCGGGFGFDFFEYVMLILKLKLVVVCFVG
jgi:hypothetical protein